MITWTAKATRIANPHSIAARISFLVLIGADPTDPRRPAAASGAGWRGAGRGATMTPVDPTDPLTLAIAIPIVVAVIAAVVTVVGFFIIVMAGDEGGD